MPSQATISRRVRAAACAAALLSAALRAQEPAPVQRTTETLAWQAALEARGFSPGLVDGIAGPKTLLAGAAFQAAEGLPVTGRLDEATGEALGVADLPPVAAYTLTREDAAQVSPCPPDWIERSRRARLLYRSLADLVAEKLHTSERCLAWLNPGTDLAALRPGDAIAVPAPRPRAAPRAAAVVEIDLERKLVLLLDAGERLCGLLHCSVAADLGDVARGEASVATIVADPEYTFDPRKWPEVKGVDRVLRIPPGPRSPVGLRWIGLDRPGVGIHGTPEPESIGKTGSHGCFRLANWDAVHLASAVSIGTTVRIVDRSAIAVELAGLAALRP